MDFRHTQDELRSLANGRRSGTQRKRMINIHGK